MWAEEGRQKVIHMNDPLHWIETGFLLKKSKVVGVLFVCFWVFFAVVVLLLG